VVERLCGEMASIRKRRKYFGKNLINKKGHEDKERGEQHSLSTINPGLTHLE
jgi:hypothetical protein